ncbi:MAG: endonuclease [Candidatus Thiodiazotropha endolucinida]|nr:endonuclease [Candidatus Thiodiazotropha endolucinida]MCW4301331.1 endonuclease [Candidatus Thiodiazotropha endolucinida]MCW4332340.1 endonuclease [Candidatus Thiodiazotropha endolucinida]
MYKKHSEAKSFYCGCDMHFISDKLIPDWQSCNYTPRKPITRKGNTNVRAKRIEWEHVLPAYWFGYKYQCWQTNGRKSCRKNQIFTHMEGDLHNLQPVIGELNQDRNNYHYAIIEDEMRRYNGCDFEVDFKLKKAEPRPEVRGDIARTYYYMIDRYNLKIIDDEGGIMKAMMAQWDKEDPVDQWERKRNDLIEAIQGNRNTFIDH